MRYPEHAQSAPPGTRRLPPRDGGKIAAESRALLKQRCDYPIFLYEAERVGITATGDADANELYPNDRLPPGCAKTCLELFREFQKDPESFFVAGPAV